MSINNQGFHYPTLCILYSTLLIHSHTLIVYKILPIVTEIEDINVLYNLMLLTVTKVKVLSMGLLD